jgi:hypothetical protein
MRTQIDYQIQAATIGRIYLEGCLLQLREAVVAQWLRENRHHPRQGDVDAELTLYRLHHKEELLEYAEYLIERYATE